MKTKISKERIPRCVKCSSLIKPNIIFYGESLDGKVLPAAFESAKQSDLCLVLGSSLAVYPAASIPETVLHHS